MSSQDALPRLLLIADRFTTPTVLKQVIDAVHAGVPWIQLRDHEADARAFERAADELLQVAAGLARPPLISVNSRLDFADTRRTAFHTGVHGASAEEALGRLGGDAVVGFSAHSVEEARRTCEQGAKYVTFSPVYPTPSKPGHPGGGTEELRRVAHAIRPVPVFALGGVTPERVPECMAAGAYGVAAIRGILGADDIERAVRVYSDSLSQGSTPDAS